MRETAHTVGAGVERLELRTPTLPPASTTNTYLISAGDEFYVVEPATPYGREQGILFEHVRSRAARGERLRGAILTHHHPDHVGAAAEFRTEFGVPVIAHARTADKLRGRVMVDETLGEGDTLLGGAVNVLHTPGHAPGHVCLLSPAGRWLIAGDMIASVGTIVIDPDDDGDMGEYLRELARLRALPLDRILPAHGDPVDDPAARLGFYLAHRAERERKVLAAIPESGTGADLAQVVERAYSDTPALLWPLAAHSARAHLAKLVTEGRVRESNGRWVRASGTGQGGV